MEPIRFSIRMICGHRIDQTCLPQSHRGLTSGRCTELCLPCDRARLCQTQNHGRRQLAMLYALTRLVRSLRGTPDSEPLGAQLQWLAVRKAVTASKITEAREQFRQRWYTQNQTTSGDLQLPIAPRLQILRQELQRHRNDLWAIRQEILRMESMAQAINARHAAAD